MKTIELDENGNYIEPTNFEAKYKDMCERLDSELFSQINLFDLKDEKGKKIPVKKNEVLPTLSVLQVNAKLSEMLRGYKPMRYSEAIDKGDDFFQDAFNWYMKLITFINKYVGYLPSKQSFSSFANITTSTYNELLANNAYADVFNSIEDYIIDFNYTAGTSSLVDSNMVQSKLQTRDAGHNLVKTAEVINFTQNNNFSTEQVLERLKKYQSEIDYKK